MSQRNPRIAIFLSFPPEERRGKRRDGQLKFPRREETVQTRIREFLYGLSGKRLVSVPHCTHANTLIHLLLLFFLFSTGPSSPRSSNEGYRNLRVVVGVFFDVVADDAGFLL